MLCQLLVQLLELGQQEDVKVLLCIVNLLEHDYKDILILLVLVCILQHLVTTQLQIQCKVCHVLQLLHGGDAEVLLHTYD